jgi:hypothetical protein
MFLYLRHGRDDQVGRDEPAILCAYVDEVANLESREWLMTIAALGRDKQMRLIGMVGLDLLLGEDADTVVKERLSECLGLHIVGYRE